MMNEYESNEIDRVTRIIGESLVGQPIDILISSIANITIKVLMQLKEYEMNSGVSHEEFYNRVSGMMDMFNEEIFDKLGMNRIDHDE